MPGRICVAEIMNSSIVVLALRKPNYSRWIPRLTGARAVRYRPFRHGQRRRYAVREPDVEQHPLAYDASHFTRFQVDHEQRLPSDYLARIGALLLHPGENDALMVAEADAELNELVRTRDVVNR